MAEDIELTPEDRAELEHKLKLRQDIGLRTHNEWWDFFLPNGIQEKVINAVGSGKHQIVLVQTANGVGKTTVLAAIIHAFDSGPQNKWFKSEQFEWFDNRTQKWILREAIDLSLYENFPYLRKGRVISDKKPLIEKVIPELHKWIPEAKTIKGDYHYESEWILPGGHRFDCMTYDQKLKEFEAVDKGWVVFDEPPPEDIFFATVRALRENGIIIIAYTPVMGSPWLVNFIRNADGKTVSYPITGEKEDNCITHGIRGFRTHEAIERQIELLQTDPNYEARVYGRAVELSQRYFPLFNSDIHVIPEDKIPSIEELTIYHICDPHWQGSRGLYGLWIGVSKAGIHYAIAEYPFESVKGRTTKKILRDFIFDFLEIEKKWDIYERILDPNIGATKDIKEGKTVQEEFAEWGFDYILGNNNKEYGYTKINKLLKYNTSEPVGTINRPILYVKDGLINTINALQFHCISPKTGKDNKDTECFAAMLRYYAAEDPEYCDKQDEYTQSTGWIDSETATRVR